MVAELVNMTDTSAATRQALAGKGITVQNWWALNTLKYKAYRQIESDMADRAVNEASGIADDAKTSAFITGSVVVLTLLLAFILAGLVARQMSRSMRQLRNAAFGIAEQRLPMLVDQLSRTDPGRSTPGSPRSRSPARTRSARSPAPSTRSTAKRSGSPPSRPCCGATSTRSSPTCRAATSR